MSTSARMSLLTLRVTGDRKPISKRSNWDDTSLKDIIDECLGENCKQQDVLKDDIEKLIAVTTVEHQLAQLKVLLSKHSQKENEGSLVFKLCSKIYFSVDPKHPLRSGIVRLLTTTSNSNVSIEEKLITELKSSLKWTVSKHTAHQPFCCNETSDMITKLSTLYENFPLGASAISSCSVEVIDCICSCLNECQTVLETSDLPPATKQDVCNCVHAAVRLGVQMLQNSQTTLDHDSVQKMSSKVHKLMEFSVLPLDTTRNCGLLMVLSQRFVCGREGCVKLYEEVICNPNKLIVITISSGLLTGLPIDDLSADNCSLFKKIFVTLKTIYQRNMADCSLLLCLTRALLALSKSTLLHGEAVCQVPDLLQFLISFTWTHLDHHMDSVCHLSNSILTNIVKLGSESQNSIKELGILKSILSLTVKTAAWKKAKHAALIALAGVLPTSEILAADPGLVETLLELLQQPTVPSYAVNSVEKLMLTHLGEVDLSTWTAVWLDPLLTSMEDQVGQTEPFGLKQVLTKAVRFSPHIVNSVLSSDKRNWSVSLSCLQACRKWGLTISSEEDANKWRGLAGYSFLQEAICDKNCQVRLACFTLLVDCKKTTELFIMEELLLLKSFFELNISENNVAARHQMLRVVGKLLTRLKDSLQTFLKTSKNKIDEEKIEAVEKNYNDFCEWLVQYCFANLFPGASLHRRSTALSILQMILKTSLWRESANTVENAKLLLLSLTDTYEENKCLASELIISMPAHLFNFDKEDCVKETFEKCVELASGIRPPDSVTAAYLLATLVKIPEAGQHILTITNKPAISVLGSEYCTISSIMDKLSDELIVAKKDIVKAALSGPLYGHLFLIRHILEQIDLSCLSESDEWRAVIGRLLTLCYECSAAVASVVNSESPEGLIPTEDDYVELLSTLSLGAAEDPIKETAQVVLLCSWRTVKETSLLLGHLAKHATITQGETTGLLSEEDLQKMGEHLTLLLCETKHRGAFEQAYVGFCKLTSRLWSFPDGSLHMIPRKWLKQTLEEIANYKRLCTTRRSAGVPFMIQALVCTELSVGGGSCFSSCMEELLALTRQEHTHSTEACTHALNILRALFRNSQLGEAVSCYVEASFITAMNMFKSSAWSERNAATLLLAALMTRVFGVPRTKGTALSWKNRMTGRIFFQRYPQLYGYLLAELRSVEASQCTVKPTIYPALLLLSRLYPSSLEGTDSNLKLDAFIPAITNCASSTVMKTRLLSARAIVSLVTPDIFVSHLKYLFTIIFDSTKENTTHGLLLQAIELLRSIPTLSDTDEDKLKQESEQWISHISKIFESQTLSNSLIVCSAYIVVLSLLHSKYVMKSNELWLRLGSQIEKHLFSTKKNSVGENEFAVAATDFLLEMMVKNVNQSQKCREKVAGLNIHLVCLLSHKLYEVKNKALDFILYLLKPYDESDDCFDYGTPTSLLKDSILNSDVLSRMILSFFFSSKIHTQDFLKVLEVVTHHPKALTFVKKAGGLNLILDLCRSDNETTVCLALECLLKALQLMEPDSKFDVSCYNLELICDIVVKNCSPESNLDYRIVITKWFNSESFTILPHLSDLNRLRLWNALMRLCCDEDLEVHAALFSTFCQVKTIHLFMSKFVIEETSDIVKMMALTAWTVGTFDLEIFNNEPDDKAFDSGELSATFEEPVLSAIAAGHLQNFLIENDKLMKTEIGEEFISWMASSCGIGALAIARTISDIGNIIETEISQKSAQLGTSYCNFLKPGFKTIVLSQIKMKNLSQYS